MKTSIQTNDMLNVLMHLFKHHMQDNCTLKQNENALIDELTELGFGADKVSLAIHWLDDLHTLQKHTKFGDPGRKSFLRVYSDYEIEHIDVGARGFLMDMLQQKLITPYDQETIINQALALDVDQVTLPIVKWVTLIVLFNHPDGKDALAQIEALVLDDKLLNETH